MADILFPSLDVTIPRNSALIDGNLVYALSDPNDKWNFYAQQLIEQDFVFLLPVAVLVESTGLCERKNDKRLRELLIGRILTFARTEGTVIVLPELPPWAWMATRYHYSKPVLDLADCLLLTHAAQLAELASFRDPIPIATADYELVSICPKFEETFSFFNLNRPDDGPLPASHVPPFKP